MKSVVGIIYAIFCLSMFLILLPKGFQYAFWVGSSNNILLLVAVVCFFIIKDEKAQKVLISTDKSSYILAPGEYNNFKNVDMDPNNSNYDEDAYVVYHTANKPTYYPERPTYYKMHIPGEKGYISPKLFHPACFIWWSLVMCAPVAIEIGLWIGFVKTVKSVFD